MEKINIEGLTNEDKDYLRWEFIKIFSKINDKVKDIKKEFEEIVGQTKNMQNLQISPFGKILLLAKKVLVNTAISRIAGIDPVYLDNDTSFLKPNNAQQKKFYQECDIRVLCDKVINDMEMGITKMIDTLQNGSEKQIMNLVTTIAENYNKIAEKANVREGDQNLEYLVFPILYNSKMIDVNAFDRFLIMRQRQVGSGMNINILNEINAAYEPLVNGDKPKQK